MKQALPQLKAHVQAALNAGNSPLMVRETIYQCAPIIGFPRTLNAVSAALGADVQIKAHAAGNLKAGNSRETLYAAMVQCLPYIGFPAAFSAINIIKSVE